MAWKKLLEEMGRLKCSKCGYSRCFAALEFHHIDPSKKKWKVSEFWQKPITQIKLEEIYKTATLCSNCHKELHANFKEE